MNPKWSRAPRCAATVIAVLLPACSDALAPVEQSAVTPPQYNLLTEITVGPPFYSMIQPGWFPMTDEWAAVAWIRETDCVPNDFNILSLVDLTILFPPQVSFPGPRPFFCDLTVSGHEIWNTFPPDPIIGPLNVVMKGLGAVPIYFVRTSELLPAIVDGVLTLTDLEAMSSLQVGYAAQFTLTNQLGTARGRPGTGMITIVAIGKLEDGTSFFFETAEGTPYQDGIVHTRIAFH